MTESLKFGPEWLRESMRHSPPKQEDTISRAIVSNYRYSREEMLGITDERNSRKNPEILPRYKPIYVGNWQTPLALLQSEAEERPVINHSRLFINSNIKHGFNHRRKTFKDELDGSWRSPSNNKENKEEIVSSLNKKSKPAVNKSWRERSNLEEPVIQSHQSPKKGYASKEESPKDYENFQLSPPKFFNERNTKKYNHSTGETDDYKSIFNAIEEPSQKSNEDEKVGKQRKAFERDPNLSACEMNLRKLEKDLLMNFSDMTIDQENKPPENKESSGITWFYIDPIGKVQGPFKEDEMSLWYTHGFFYDDLMLRRSIDTNFISLRHLIHAFGNAQPFALATTGFPIPKLDNQILENMQNTYNMQAPKVPLLASQQNQWNNIRPNSESNQFQNMQYQQNHPQVYQYPPNRPAEPQIQPQLDPRMYNMTTVHPYAQMYGNNVAMNLQRPPPNQIYHQPPMIPMVNNQYNQSMIQQMPYTAPSNPIQKLLFELQKQKEMEIQRQTLYYQQNMPINGNNVASQSLNGQFMHQNHQNLKKVDNNHQSQKYHQNYYNTQPNNAHTKPSNGHMQEMISDNFDVENDGGEFRIVANLKRKKFQKEIREQQINNHFVQMPKQAKNTTFFDNNATTDVYHDQSVSSNKSSPDEKSTKPAKEAPWLETIQNDLLLEKKNLERIQLEEEEIRRIKKQMQHEAELERRKKEKEMKQRISKLTWNALVKEDVGENLAQAHDSIWEEPKVVLNKSVKKTRIFNNSAKQQQKQKEDLKNLLSIEKENEFKDWCIEYLTKKMKTKIDIPVFSNFLAGLESPYEVEDYVKMYLGDSIESTLFTRQFLERRSSYRKAAKIVEIDDDLCAPPRAINPGTNEEKTHKTHRKRKVSKKPKKTMKVVDINILGFKGTAASNRIVGELHEDEY